MRICEAEGEGFEPSKPLGTRRFLRPVPFAHSAIPPLPASYAASESGTSLALGTGLGVREMDDKKPNNEFVFFNPRPTGEPVNSYVFRIEPQRGLDYFAIQRFIKKSAELISAKKPQD
jgi:hypothetical protein